VPSKLSFLGCNCHSSVYCLRFTIARRSFFAGDIIKNQRRIDGDRLGIGLGGSGSFILDIFCTGGTYPSGSCAHAALVVFGLLLGAGKYSLALRALFLFLANFISVNLAGIATLLAQGIEPRTWWEAKKAKRATLLAIVGWALLLAILVIIILFFGDFRILKQ